MPIMLLLAISLVTGALAARKGYHFMIWVLASGLLGLVILAFLPFANSSELSAEKQQQLKKKGNTIGGTLAVLGVILLFAQLWPL